MLIKPPSLKSKDRIALLAPSSRPFRPSLVKRAAAIVESMDFTPVIGAHVLDTHGAMAGADQARLADLTSALEDESIAAIWFLTGGFGSLRLVKDLPYAAFAARPKIVIGADDTSHLLLALHQATNVVTFYGPNLDRIDNREAISRLALFFKAKDQKIQKTQKNQKDQANSCFAPMQVRDKILENFCFAPVAEIREGAVLGANLTALISLFGTKFEPNLADRILLLEDRNERNDILDRWFTTLYISGKLAKTAALGLGQFENCGTRNSSNMLSFEELVTDRVAQMALPTCFNLPFGQSSDCSVVPLGLRARLDTGAGKLEYLESAFTD